MAADLLEDRYICLRRLSNDEVGNAMTCLHSRTQGERKRRERARCRNNVTPRWAIATNTWRRVVVLTLVYRSRQPPHEPKTPKGCGHSCIYWQQERGAIRATGYRRQVDYTTAVHDPLVQELPARSHWFYCCECLCLAAACIYWQQRWNSLTFKDGRAPILSRKELRCARVKPSHRLPIQGVALRVRRQHRHPCLHDKFIHHRVLGLYTQGAIASSEMGYGRKAEWYEVIQGDCGRCSFCALFPPSYLNRKSLENKPENRRNNKPETAVQETDDDETFLIPPQILI